MAEKDQTPPSGVKDLKDGAMQGDQAKSKGQPLTGDKSGKK